MLVLLNAPFWAINKTIESQGNIVKTEFSYIAVPYWINQQYFLYSSWFLQIKDIKTLLNTNNYVSFNYRFDRAIYSHSQWVQKVNWAQCGKGSQDRRIAGSRELQTQLSSFDAPFSGFKGDLCLIWIFNQTNLHISFTWTIQIDRQRHVIPASAAIALGSEAAFAKGLLSPGLSSFCVCGASSEINFIPLFFWLLRCVKFCLFSK